MEVFKFCDPIENGSRLPDVIETSFWALWTPLYVLSKSQTKHEDVKLLLQPLPGGQSFFLGYLWRFQQSIMGSGTKDRRPKGRRFHSDQTRIKRLRLILTIANPDPNHKPNLDPNPIFSFLP